jgi:3-methyladenine DNA glycosylase AlkD
MNSLTIIRKKLRAQASKQKATILQGFFKTGPGEYGEGDCFIGVTVPEIRKLSKEAAGLGRAALLKLLRSPVHEERLLALLALIEQFGTGDDARKRRVYATYLANTRWINNWDLVDLSAKQIVGGYLFDKDRKRLYSLVRSKNLWERRIAILATFYFIGRNQYGDSLKIAALLLNDKEDLIHKAVGWMLREVGKRDQELEERFLRVHHARIPRTALRYSIERFSPEKKRMYMDT